MIVRRFLCIFLPPAVYSKIKLVTKTAGETFTANFKLLVDPGYLLAAGGKEAKKQDSVSKEQTDAILSLKKGMKLPIKKHLIKDGTTTPPKRYNSGSLILAMENAGQRLYPFSSESGAYRKLGKRAHLCGRRHSK